MQAQIAQLAGGPIDPVAGDLSLSVAPVLAWGAYLWDRDAPRSFFGDKGIHPTNEGAAAAAAKLFAHFSQESWF